MFATVAFTMLSTSTWSSSPHLFVLGLDLRLKVDLWLVLSVSSVPMVDFFLPPRIQLFSLVSPSCAAHVLLFLLIMLLPRDVPLSLWLPPFDPFFFSPSDSFPPFIIDGLRECALILPLSSFLDILFTFSSSWSSLSCLASRFVSAPFPIPYFLPLAMLLVIVASWSFFQGLGDRF